jgi:hypothetical protein
MVQYQIQTNEFSKGISIIVVEDANGTKKAGSFFNNEPALTKLESFNFKYF